MVGDMRGGHRRSDCSCARAHDDGDRSGEGWARELGWRFVGRGAEVVNGREGGAVIRPQPTLWPLEGRGAKELAVRAVIAESDGVSVALQDLVGSSSAQVKFARAQARFVFRLRDGHELADAGPVKVRSVIVGWARMDC